MTIHLFNQPSIIVLANFLCIKIFPLASLKYFKSINDPNEAKKES